MIRGGLVTLFVRDVSTSVRFYIETLGMKLVEEEASSAMIDAGDGFRIALRAGGAGREAPADSAAVGLLPKVPLREAIAIFENRGVAFNVAEEATRTLARFRDPDGNSLYLFQAK